MSIFKYLIMYEGATFFIPRAFFLESISKTGYISNKEV